MNRTIDLVYQTSHVHQPHRLQPGMAFWAVLVALVYTLATLWLPHHFSSLRYSDSIFSAYGPVLPDSANTTIQQKPFRIPDTILPLIADAPHTDITLAFHSEPLISESAPIATDKFASKAPLFVGDIPLQPAKLSVTPSLSTVAERMTTHIKSNRIDAALHLQQQAFTGAHTSRISSIILEKLIHEDADLAASWLAIAPGLNLDQQAYWRARLAGTRGKHADVIRALKSEQAAWLEHPAQHREELALLGAAHLADGDSAQALAIFRCLTQQKNINSHWYLGLAMAAEQQGERKLAISAYRNSLAPDDMSIHSKRFAYNRLNTILMDNDD